jgi:hypothetical protein
MKCIKKGKPPEQRLWQGECYHCNSVFEALEGELSHIENDVRENTRFAKAMCEICKRDFFLHPVKANVRAYYKK